MAEEERAAVFRTTKVRTKLKGDASWMQRRNEPDNETREEKPWIAEVRASRVDGAPVETSPVSSPTTFTPSHNKSDTERAPASGFLISAPHTVRFSPENQEGKLSHEEQEKRVEITDDDESVTTPAPVSTPPPSPTVPVTSVSEPRPRNQVDTSIKTAVDVTVNEPVAPKVVEATPKPVKEDLPPVSVTEKDPFENMKPGCTKVATPLPELIPVYVQAVSTDPEPDNSEVSGTPLVKVTPASPTPVSPTLASPAPETSAPETPAPETPAPEILAPESPAPETPAPVSPAPEILAPESPTPETPAPESPAPETPAPVSPAPEILAPESPAPETPSPGSPAPETPAPVSPAPEIPAPVTPAPETPAPETPAPASPAPETPAPASPAPASNPPVSSAPVSAVEEDTVKTEPEPSPNQSSKDDEPALAEDEGGSADSHTEDGVVQKPTLALSSGEAITADLLALSDGPEESAEPVPPSPGRWSQDLLTELDSESDPAKTSCTLDVLLNDVIVINTEIGSLSTQQEEEKQTNETAKEIESSSDLLQPLADISINSMSSDALEYLTADIFPINTDTTSQNDAPGDQAEDQQMLVKFERKSTDNDSPWDRWTSPTVYTITTTTDEEEEKRLVITLECPLFHSPEDTQTVTTVTTIRETRSEPEPAMDRGFVYLKEYVNATELSLHNTRDTIDSGSDGLTSSSVNYSYSSPSTYSSGSLSSTCTYCGELVGNDARITIEHLNINCHPACFKCGECGKAMGDLLYNMFLHGGKVHCESCYSKALD
ncbi:hypothetical protein PAMP_023555 [Pampus punctatissimus]